MQPKLETPQVTHNKLTGQHSFKVKLQVQVLMLNNPVEDKPTCVLGWHVTRNHDTSYINIYIPIWKLSLLLVCNKLKKGGQFVFMTGWLSSSDHLLRSMDELWISPQLVKISRSRKPSSVRVGVRANPSLDPDWTDWSNQHRDELCRWCEVSVKFMEMIWRLSLVWCQRFCFNDTTTGKWKDCLHCQQSMTNIPHRPRAVTQLCD